MPSICLVIDSLGGGGAEGVCVNLANKLSTRGWAVTLVVLHLDNAVRKKDLFDEVQLVVLGKKHARTALFALSTFLKQNQPNRVLVFNHQLAVLLVLLRKVKAKKFKLIARNRNTLSQVRSQERSFWHKHIAYMLTKLLYKKVDYIIAQSHGMAVDLEEKYGITKELLIVIHNPLGQAFESRGVVESSASEISVEGDYLLCVGRLERQKSQHYAIKAFAKISDQFPNLRLKIVGEGSLKEQLKSLSHELNIHNKVDFVDYEANIIPFYAGAKATLLTSLYEGFPNVLVESISLGVPVVAFDCPSGPSEIVQDGINGFLVNYCDENHLVQSLRKALTRSWDVADIAATANLYRMDTIIAKYEKVLR